MEHLNIKSLGPIKEASIKFGDLTLLVGPQASGKSILLQVVKLVIDKFNIASVLKQNNYEWGRKSESFLDLFFGESMSAIWSHDSRIEFDGQEYTVSSFPPRQSRSESARSEKLFYIPAQRVVTMSQGLADICIKIQITLFLGTNQWLLHFTRIFPGEKGRTKGIETDSKAVT